MFKLRTLCCLYLYQNPKPFVLQLSITVFFATHWFTKTSMHPPFFSVNIYFLLHSFQNHSCCQFKSCKFVEHLILNVALRTNLAPKFVRLPELYAFYHSNAWQNTEHYIITMYATCVNLFFFGGGGKTENGAKIACIYNSYVKCFW